MECRRCRVPMVKERLYDYLENDGQFYPGPWKWVYRCVACSNVTNWIVEQHRQMVGSAGLVDERTGASHARFEHPSIDE
jgi:hypothetical protein